MNGLYECFVEVVSEAISKALGINKDKVLSYFRESKLKISKTPDPSMGDYGVSLHFLFHRRGISRDEWENVASRIIDYLKTHGYMEKCFIREAVFMNGYLNLYIDYSVLFKWFVKRVVSREIFDKLRNMGRGVRVLVEHTSANPIHPLHVGSGRNSILGNTFARLLRYLGFEVREHFYVNDMGRQVAILVYGYSLVKEKGLERPGNVKVDHWFGAIYALTNIFIEKIKLSSELNKLEQEIAELLRDYWRSLSSLIDKYRKYDLVKLKIILDNTLAKLKLKHETEKLVSYVLRSAGETLKTMDNEELRRLIEKHLEALEKKLKQYIEYLEEERELSMAENNLCNTYPDICIALRTEIRSVDEAENRIRELMAKYEAGDEETSRLFHEVVDNVLEGFRETFDKLGIVFDQYDWESGEAGRKYLSIVIEGVEKLPYTIREGEALIVDLDAASREHGFIKELFGEDQPGRFVIRRGDGTTLYTTRDVAYSIYKFRDLGFDRVYNVIAVEQVREQKQVKATLALLGFGDYADRLTHFVYEMVNLKGARMSSRRGQYYSLDELIEDYTRVIAEKYIENQVRLGRREVSIELDRLYSVFRKLGIACTRALLLSIDPYKVLTFDPKRLEEYDLGSWIIYTFVRIQSILRKAYGFEPLESMERLFRIMDELYSEISNEDLVLNSEERNILETLTGFEQVLVTAYKDMKPNKILEYTNNLCMYINKLYETHPVLGEKDGVKKNTRLLLLIASLIMLKDLQEIMGFPLISRL